MITNYIGMLKQGVSEYKNPADKGCNKLLKLNIRINAKYSIFILEVSWHAFFNIRIYLTCCLFIFNTRESS